MTVALAFLFVSIGIVLHAVHSHICRQAESNAYTNGYQQAAKEEQIRKTTYEETMKRLPPPQPQFQHLRPRLDDQPATGDRQPMVTQDFMDHLAANRRAVMQMK